jgi:hypothetical protein
MNEMPQPRQRFKESWTMTEGWVVVDRRTRRTVQVHPTQESARTDARTRNQAPPPLSTAR